MEVTRLVSYLPYIIIPIIGVLILVSISSRFFGPECRTILSGDPQYIFNSLRICVEKCWSKHDYGKDNLFDDCFSIRLRSENDLKREDTSKILTNVPLQSYFNILEKEKDYRIKVRYNSTAPEISLVLECDIIQKNFQSLLTCDGKDVVSLHKNLLVIGDSTPFMRCCDDFSVFYENMLLNAAKFFGGERILIVYDDPSADPTLPSRQRLMSSLSDNFVVDSLLHESPLSFDMLNAYDQVWLVRPGICDNLLFSILCKYSWNEQDFESLREFIKEKKVILITDYEEIIPQRVENRIIEMVNANLTFVNGCFCGCGGDIGTADEVITHEITDGIDFFPIDAATGIKVKCVV